jgi:hypothetical protein
MCPGYESNTHNLIDSIYHYRAACEAGRCAGYESNTHNLIDSIYQYRVAGEAWMYAGGVRCRALSNGRWRSRHRRSQVVGAGEVHDPDDTRLHYEVLEACYHAARRVNQHTETTLVADIRVLMLD